MSDKSSSAPQLLNWNSKADSAKEEAYALFERSLVLKLDAGEYPCGFILDQEDYRCKERTVKKKLPRVQGLLYGKNSEAKVADWTYRSQVREAHRKSARDANKKLAAQYVKGMAALQCLFQGDCIAASVLTNAVDHSLNSASNFYRQLAALEKAYKPNTTVDAL
jgi:5-methylcytosine-specific restriction endonuclease McrA